MLSVFLILIYISYYFQLRSVQRLPTSRRALLARLGDSLRPKEVKDLVTLDTINAFCGGPVPTPKAHRLQAYTHRRKFLLLAYPSSISILVLTLVIVFLCFLFQKWT